MAMGAPYDSDRGRAIAGSITALMCGEAYQMSTRMAARLGPFAGFTEDADNVTAVLEMHAGAIDGLDAELAPAGVLTAARSAWSAAIDASKSTGVRNAQATVLAPTGTISFLMDCDTTGIEPDLGLVKMKKLCLLYTSDAADE